MNTYPRVVICDCYETAGGHPMILFEDGKSVSLIDDEWIEDDATPVGGRPHPESDKIWGEYVAAKLLGQVTT